MESCLKTKEIYCNNIEEYKVQINHVIEDMISKNERLAFADVSERAGVTPFTIRKYPELRSYILQKMIYYKEIQVINKKLHRAVNSLLKSNKRITFMAIIKKCRFGSDTIYKNHYIKNKIRSILVENK